VVFRTQGLCARLNGNQALVEVPDDSFDLVNNPRLESCTQNTRISANPGINTDVDVFTHFEPDIYFTDCRVCTSSRCHRLGRKQMALYDLTLATSQYYVYTRSRRPVMKQCHHLSPVHTERVDASNQTNVKDSIHTVERVN